MTKQLPSQAELKQVFEYDAETGILTRKGKPVGCRGNGCGYTVKYKYVLYRVARIIWRLQTGEDPGEMYVDHINRDPYDNRWENLRLVTQAQNQMNRAGSNISVTPQGHFRVMIGSEKRHRVFHTLKEAEEWRDEMKKEMFGAFACVVI